MAKGRPKTAVERAVAKLGVALPEEYAAFLDEGRAHEGGTLLTIDQALTYETLRIDRPFPFTKADAKKILKARAQGDDAFLELEDSVGGVLPIADAGCNDLTYLVLTGPLRGSIWSGGEPGWLPHARADGTLVGFRDWLETIADEPKNMPARTAKRTKKPPPTIDPKAYQLNLRNLGLTTVPEEAFAMTSVAMMYLGGNALRELPPSFTKLAGTLHTLELGPNPLRSVPGNVLAKLVKLTKLDLRGTRLKTLPSEIARLPIENLHLDDNPGLDIEGAVAVMRSMTTLKWLSLAKCKLKTVPRGISDLVHLKRLYLNDNAIVKLPPSLTALSLDILGVMDNRIEKIPDELEPHIRNLYFGGNPGARTEKKRLDRVRRGFVMLG